MAVANEGPDALRWLDDASAIIDSLAWVGAPAGVIPLQYNGNNGPGAGLWQIGAGGTTLSWRAPGSATFGDAVDVSAGGEFAIIDGEDVNKSVRVLVVAASLPPNGQSQISYLSELYSPATAGEDAYSNSPQQTFWTINLKNDHPTLTLANVYVWNDPTAQYMEISTDGVNWSNPQTEGAALLLAPTLAPGATVPLYNRRTLSDTSGQPRVSRIIHGKFTQGSGIWYADLLGAHRVFDLEPNQTAYRMYWSNTGPPAPGATPDETSLVLPYKTTNAFADGTWWTAMSRWNGCLDSGFLPFGPNGETFVKVVLAGGVEVLPPPPGPNDVNMIETTDGVIRLTGFCQCPGGPARGDEWAIGWTSDGTDPPSGSPYFTAPLASTDIAVLDYNIPIAFLDGVTVKVVVQTRRNDGTESVPAWTYSIEEYRAEIVINSSGPEPAQAVQVWPRPIGEGTIWV